MHSSTRRGELHRSGSFPWEGFHGSCLLAIVEKDLWWPQEPYQSVPSISTSVTDSQGLVLWLCIKQFLPCRLIHQFLQGETAYQGPGNHKCFPKLTSLPTVYLSSKYLVGKETHNGVAPAGQETSSGFVAFLSPHLCWFGFQRGSCSSQPHSYNYSLPTHSINLPRWAWVKSFAWPVTGLLVLNINKFLRNSYIWEGKGYLAWIKDRMFQKKGEGKED